MTFGLREQDLDWREVGEEIVVLDLQGAVYFAVQGSAAILWRRLAESATRDGLVEALVKTYGIDTARATGDVDEFLATLNERGLLAS